MLHAVVQTRQMVQLLALGMDCICNVIHSSSILIFCLFVCIRVGSFSDLQTGMVFISPTIAWLSSSDRNNIRAVDFSLLQVSVVVGSISGIGGSIDGIGTYVKLNSISSLVFHSASQSVFATEPTIVMHFFFIFLCFFPTHCIRIYIFLLIACRILFGAFASTLCNRRR
jgi:hypothetical protein